MPALEASTPVEVAEESTEAEILDEEESLFQKKDTEVLQPAEPVKLEQPIELYNRLVKEREEMPVEAPAVPKTPEAETDSVDELEIGEGSEDSLA